MLTFAPGLTGEMLSRPWVQTQVGGGVRLKTHGLRSPLEQLSQEPQTPESWLAVRALPPHCCVVLFTSHLWASGFSSVK